MKLFGKSTKAERFGAVIDIGSGSVAVSIVHSIAGTPAPTIVWHWREHTELKNIESLDQSAKAVMTALMNTLLKLNSEGRKALHEYKAGSRITEAQYSIAAPWSYTINKNINYSQDNFFVVTEEMITEMVETAQSKTALEINENETIKELGLALITESTMDLLANGYKINNPIGEKTKDLSINHASVLTQQQIIAEIDNLSEKIFAGVETKKLSFMLVLYCVSQDLFPHTQDVCLVDVTYEATEIGIVRGGSLLYSTHTPYGSLSLAREIAHTLKVPLAEAFGHLHTEAPFAFIETLPAEQKKDIKDMFNAYTDRLSALFKETGDSLTIPKKVYLHTDHKSELLFTDLVEKAVKKSAHSPATVKLLTSKILKIPQNEANKELKTDLSDTALLASAQFFHKQNHCRSFDYS